VNLELFAAPLAVAALVAAWLAVQRAWTRAFPEVGEEPDALAARGDGKSCSRSCDDSCEPDARGRCAGSGEERR